MIPVVPQSFGPVFGIGFKQRFTHLRSAGTFFAAIALVMGMLVPVTKAHAQQAPQVLQHHVRPEITNHQAALVNRLTSDHRLQMSIVLPLRNEDALSSLIGRLYDPSSPDYRKFLSVAQFTEQFGPTKEDYDAVVAFATANGFTITGDPANRMIVPVSGTTDQVNKAFNVQMNVYQHPTENRTFFSPDREPSLALGVRVAHISGLDDFSLPHHFARHAQNTEQPLAVTGSGPGGSYLGSDMRTVYYGGSTLTGNNQAVGILEFGGYQRSDVDLTFSNAGQSYSVPINNVLLDGATGAPSGSDGEQTLDIVQAIGMAPGLSQVRVYIGVGSDDANILNSMASENIAKQLSCSWGWRPADPAAADVFFKEMAAQGQSFFTSSGDAGAFDVAINPFFFPAEDAYVTAVGGTHLTTNGAGGTWASETVWNSQGYGSGGGVSPDNIGIPSWQSGVANTANGGSTTLRNVPDVAMEGDFDNYACALGVCSGGYAGTSFSAPRWAGFMALVNQQAAEAGTAPNGIGFLNPQLYLLAEGSHFSNDLHDIVSGNNDTANQPIWFSAVSGYDLATGWGSPTGQSLIDDLAGPQIPGFFLGSSQTVVAVNPGGSGSTTLTVTDAGGFTGSVNFAVTSTLPSGVTASFSPNPATGTSVLTLTASSSAVQANTQVTVTGTSGNVSATTTFTMAVHAPTFALSASPNTLGINQGASGTANITVVPQYGFNDLVTLAVSGLPSGVTASFSPATTTGSSTLTLAVSSSATPGTSTITITGASGSLTATSIVSLAIHGPSFTLSGSTSVSVGQGSTGSAYLYVTDLYGFSGSVNLAASGLPSGVTASFSPNPATGSSTMTLTASSSAAVGKSTITITGTSGTLTASTTLTLGVYAPTFTLSSSTSVSVGQGSSATAYLYISPQYGFNGSVNLTASGLPSGVTALWNPNPTTSSSTLTLVASSAAKAGQYTVTITGVSGTQTASTTLTLGVYAPTFTVSSSYSVNIGQGTTSTAYVYVTPQYGFSGSVTLSISGLPSGITGSFSPNPTTGTSTLTLQAAGTAALGQYTATITGTSGTQTVSTTLTVGVYTPTFTLANYGGINVGRGASSTGYIYITPQYGFTGSVNLAVSGLPAGVTASFSPNPTTSNSTLTISASSAAALGQYTVTVTGTSGTQTASTTFTVGVYTPTFTLYANGSVTLGQGTTSTSYVSITPQYGFTGSVSLAVSGLPAGVTASFSPNPATSSATLTLTASSTAALGQYNLTITGTSGSQSVTTPLTLGVYAPTFTLSAYGPASIGQGASGSSYVYINTQYGFAGSVNLSVSGLPSGVTAWFSPNPATGNSLLTLTASSAAAVGSTTLTITGTSGAQTATTTLVVNVYTPTFTLYSYLNSASVNPGASATGYVSISDLYGFSGSVALTASGLPSGVTATFSPNPVTGTSSNLVIAASASAVPGTYTVTIMGTSGTVTASTTVQLTINTPGYTLAAAPGKINVLPGNSAKAAITLAAVNGFTGSVSLAASGLPAGVSATFSPASTTTSSTLTLAASSAATPGTSTVTITGTSGGVTASTSLNLTVLSASTATSTTLALTASGTTASSVNAGTMVTATATVSAGSATVAGGQVNFCDASATICDALHLIGTAQLTNAGVAVLHFIPGTGSRSYQAVFVGTNANAASVSTVSALTVTGSLPTVTTIAQSGAAGNYTLTSTVTGSGPSAPSGSVSFLDTSNGNASLGQAALVSGTPTYSSTTRSVTVGSSPEFSATGDFNGDGIPDVAVANYGSNYISILLGKGDGTFTAAANLTTSSGSAFVAIGDFNHDGKADLAVLPYVGTSVLIFLGNGDGTFTPAASSPLTTSYPTALAVVDLNGDGLQDLAIVSELNSALNILLGNGDGTFTPTSSPATGYAPRSVASGDFNGDGVPDLAIANNSSGTLTLLLGNGDGTFSAIAGPTVGYSSTSVLVADLNRDGKQDIVVGNQSSAPTTVLLGNGDGTFTTGTAAALGSNPLALGIADFNGDGNPDLVSTNYYNSTLTIAMGNGDGTFGTPATISTGSSPTAISIADWNGDGIADLATVNYGNGTLTVLTSALAQKATATATGVSPLGSGQHTVEASYAASSSYAASVSATTNLTAAAGRPSVSLSLSASSITALQPLTVTVTVSGGSGNPAPTGSVTLTSGSYSSAPATLNGGSAVITVSAGSLAVGSDTLSGVYTPDAASTGTYTTATGTGAVTVSKVTPGVVVGLSALNITTVQPLTVTVAVNSGTTASPTGSVVLTSGTYTSAALALSGGSAVFTIPAGSLAPGNDTLSAAYTPDASGSPIYNSSSGSSTVTVGKTTPAVTLSLSGSSITEFQPLAVTIAVNSGVSNATPTGSVTLTSGSYTSAPATLSGGNATITVPGGSLPPGNDALSVSYTPDASGSPIYNTATGSGSITVNKVTPTVTLSLSATSITTLQPLTVTLAVNGGTGASTATGSVILTSGNYTSAATTLSNGSATIQIPAGSLIAGADALSVSYTPDASGSPIYNSATGSGSVTVTKALPALSFNLFATSITTAQPLTATVSVSGGTGTTTPSGSITLTSGSYTSAAAALVNGSAAIVIPAASLPVGNDTLQAVYTPDAASAPVYAATSASATVMVTAAIGTSTPTVTVIPSPGTITNLMTDTVMVTVAGVSGQPTPTGTLTLSSGSYTAQAMLSGGLASFTIAAGSLSAGSDTLTAAYSGDAAYAVRNGTATVTVAAVLMTVSTVAPISAGSSGSSTLTLTAGSNYSGTMNLSCALAASPAGAQSLPTCRFNSTSLTLTAGGTASTTLIVSTTAASHAALEIPSGFKQQGYLYGAPIMAAALFFLLPSRRRRFAALVVLMGALAAGLSGCAGGSTQGSQSGTTLTPATTAGTYTFNVTAADSASGPSTSSTITVTVQ